MNTLPVEVLYLIADCVAREPGDTDYDVNERQKRIVNDPIAQICKLSLVNKTFHEVFTSDRVWRRFDFYDLNEGIFRDFTRRLSVFDLRLLRDPASFYKLTDGDHSVGYPGEYAINISPEEANLHTDNKFVLYMCLYWNMLCNAPEDVPFMRKVVEHDPELYGMALSDSLDDPEIIRAAMKHRKNRLSLAGDFGAQSALAYDVDFCKELIAKTKDSIIYCNLPKDVQRNPDVAQEMAKYDISALQCISGDVRLIEKYLYNEDLFVKYISDVSGDYLRYAEEYHSPRVLYASKIQFPASVAGGELATNGYYRFSQSMEAYFTEADYTTNLETPYAFKIVPPVLSCVTNEDSVAAIRVMVDPSTFPELVEHLRDDFYIAALAVRHAFAFPSWRTKLKQIFGAVSMRLSQDKELVFEAARSMPFMMDWNGEVYELEKFTDVIPKILLKEMLNDKVWAEKLLAVHPAWANFVNADFLTLDHVAACVKEKCFSPYGPMGKLSADPGIIISLAAQYNGYLEYLENIMSTKLPESTILHPRALKFYLLESQSAEENGLKGCDYVYKFLSREDVLSVYADMCSHGEIKWEAYERALRFHHSGPPVMNCQAKSIQIIKTDITVEYIGKLKRHADRIYDRVGELTEIVNAKRARVLS